MKKYFENVKTVADLRKQYIVLLKQFHPDNENGSEEIMKVINVEYESLFEKMKNINEAEKTDTNEYKDENEFSWDVDENIRDILMNIINIKDIIIEVRGYWVWVSGKTFECKETLKSLAFKPLKKEKTFYWVWHPDYGVSYKRKSKMTMKDIDNKYGCSRVTGSPLFID